MLSKKKQLNNCRLYLILDAAVNTYDELLNIAELAVASGVDIVQLRDKNGQAQNILAFSKQILKITRRKIPYIMNDRVDLAKAAQADGVHLGQEDLSVELASRMLGSKAIIGKSCQTIEHLKAAQKEKADYIGFGSIFKTLTKPDRAAMNLSMLRQAVQSVEIPIFAIGGIKLDNIKIVKEAGVKRIAVCREICLAKDVKKTIREFKRRLVTGAGFNLGGHKSFCVPILKNPVCH